MHVVTAGVPACRESALVEAMAFRNLAPDVSFASSNRMRLRIVRREVAASLSAINPDVTLVGNYQPLLWPSILRTLEKPYCLFAHGGDVAALLRTGFVWRRTRARQLFASAARVLCNSSYSAGLVQRLSRSEFARTCVVGCGTDLPSHEVSSARARQLLRLNLSPEVPVIVTVARLVPHKGIDTTLRALSILASASQNFHHLIVGDGQCGEALKDLSVALGIADRVTFLGRVSDEVKLLAYRASDLFVLTPRIGSHGAVEGFGIVFLEANAHGLAAIGTDVGGIPDAIEDGVNGLLVKPDSPHLLSDAIASLLVSPSRRAEMAQRGTERVRTTFNWSAIAARIESELTEVVADSHQSGTQTPVLYA